MYIVEDSGPVRERLFRVIEAISGRRPVGWSGGATKAVSEIRKLKPRTVVLDLELDEGSGWDVLRQTRSDSVRPRFIVFSNQADAATRRRALELGAAQFFDKTSEFDEFLATIQELQESRTNECS